MRIDVHSPEFVYGCWDIFFSFVYFIVFLVFLPTYRPMTRFVTFFFPSLLGAGGLYLLFRGPHARTVGFALAVLFAFLCLAILALLSYVIGMFYGIYGLGLAPSLRFVPFKSFFW